MTNVEAGESAVSHYRIVQKLGSGGMSEVYLAEDTVLPRVVALKLLPPDRSGDDALQHRLMREARAASALTHPNIARIYEAGEDGGRFFIAMEYIDGESLESLIARGPLPIDDIVRIALQLVAAVEDAHKSGVIHRDLKASNVMLTSRREVKVLDFGLAKFDNPEAAPIDTTAWKTESGLILGTPPYMSPEQAMSKRLDQRSDIFSIGVLLYELVTGRRPFDGSNVNDTFFRILNAQPEAMARFNYELPAELERIIRKCLEKSPERRYQTATDLLVDLRNFDRDRHLGAQEKADRIGAAPLRMQRRIWFAAALFVLIATGVFVSRHFMAGPDVKSLAVLPFANQAGSPDTLSEGIADRVISEIAQAAPGLTVIARDTTFRDYGPNASPMAVGKALHVDTVLKGTTYIDGDRVIADFDLIDARDGSRIGTKILILGKGEVPRLAAAIREEVLGWLQIRPPSSGRSTHSSGVTVDSNAYGLYMRGIQQWSTRKPENLASAIDSFRRTIELEPTFAPAYAGLANTYSVQERYAKVPNVESRSNAIAAAKHAVQFDPLLPEAHAALASVLDTYEWQWAEADREYRKAIELNRSYATAHHWHALLLTRLGRFAEAREEIAHARDLDPRSPVIATAVANIDYYAGDFRRSADEARAALLIDPKYPMSRAQLVLSLVMSGDLAAAQRELQLMDESAGERQLLAVMIRARSGDVATARAALDAAGSHAEPNVAYPLASVYMVCGDSANALKWLRTAADAHSFWIGYVAVDPVFKPLHGSPEFDALLTTVGLPRNVS